MTLKIDVSYELADAILIQNLTQTLDSMREDLRKAKEGDHSAIFETDPKEDIKQMKKFIKSLERVIEWYSGDTL